jgi:hypothetical protein
LFATHKEGLLLFQTLMESHVRGELLLVDGGLCRFRKRQDGVVVMYEIIAQRRGVGSAMLAALCVLPGITAIAAKCPSDFASNGWYNKKGFRCTAIEHTRSGTLLYHWHLVVPG